MRGSTARLTVGGVIVVAAISVVGWQWWESRRSELPETIVFGNGRIEADQVDVAAKYAGRIDVILVEEGEMVEAGQTLARMDTAELDAGLARAEAKLAEAEEAVTESAALVTERESELRFAEQEYARGVPLAEKGSLSERVVEQRRSVRDRAVAAVDAAEAHLRTAERAVDATRAAVTQVQTQLDECVLKSTVQGRVLYRLAEPGEVLSSGGKVLTLLDLSNVYMEIFLPSHDAALLAVGAEARIVLDAMSDFAIPAHVSFVSPEAQFTPKHVETVNERENLVFRVKVRISRERLMPHIDRVKTGLRGLAYVRLDESTPWPAALERRFQNDVE